MSEPTGPCPTGRVGPMRHWAMIAPSSISNPAVPVSDCVRPRTSALGCGEAGDRVMIPHVCSNPLGRAEVVSPPRRWRFRCSALYRRPAPDGSSLRGDEVEERCRRTVVDRRTPTRNSTPPCSRRTGASQTWPTTRSSPGCWSLTRPVTGPSEDDKLGRICQAGRGAPHHRHT